ncbi:MAG: adenylate/guanylate cyclase domain-containing protein [Leptospirales bacterium]|nr:adenylate/guanylate cyclase domain-containing protein [Leptospirales bacterium]
MPGAISELNLGPGFLRGLSGAEIHKYVGDEAILLWSTQQGRKTLNCIRFFGLFKLARQRASAKYARRYGLQPEFRAGLHFGKVVAGEMGNLRKEVAYLGDAMNTGARMLDAAKRMNRQIVISESAREALDPHLEAEDLGAHPIRGKQNEMRLYSVDYRTLKAGFE